MILKKGNFYINGKNGIEDLHAILENYPTINIPKRKKSLTSIEGGNEQIILDEGAYDNRELNLNIIVRAYDEEDRTLRLSALYSAFDTDKYISFMHYGEPNYEYLISNAEVVTSSRLTRTSYYSEVKIKLTAKAFKQYRPDESVTVKGTTKTFNRFNYASRPLIHILNSGVSTIAINGKPYTFGPLPSGGAWVDCEESQQDVYNGNTIVENAFAVGQEFPSLPPGIVTITAGNAIVYPRWRTI